MNSPKKGKEFWDNYHGFYVLAVEYLMTHMSEADADEHVYQYLRDREYDLMCEEENHRLLKELFAIRCEKIDETPLRDALMEVYETDDGGELIPDLAIELGFELPETIDIFGETPVNTPEEAI